MRYDLIIFDFDGTLADTFPFFVDAQNALARKHRFRTIAPHEIDGLRHLSPRELMRHVGLSRWRLPLLTRDFIRHMHAHGHAVRMFDGVAPALQRLSEDGAQLALVTSNGADNCRRILGEDVMARFAHVECGASIFGKRRRLRRVLSAAGVAPSRAIYVGDMTPDAEAARDVGMDFAAVGWGYGALDALRAHKPAVVLERIDAIAHLRGKETT
jgi:phosphoglycolate phosphatase